MSQIPTPTMSPESQKSMTANAASGTSYWRHVTGKQTSGVLDRTRVNKDWTEIAAEDYYNQNQANNGDQISQDSDPYKSFMKDRPKEQWGSFMNVYAGSATPSGGGGGAPGGSSGGGGTPGGGAKVNIPEPDMGQQGVPGMGGDGGGGGMDGSAGQSISGPSRFRQGIGQRMFPNDSPSLSALRGLY